MKIRHVLLSVAILAIIIVSLGVVATVRVQQLPSQLTIFVTFKYLSRNRDYSYTGGQNLVRMDLTAKNETSDNVTLVPPAFPNQTTGAYWRLQIVLNESAANVPLWIHDIEKDNDTAGEFSGTVSTSFAGLRGNFTVWITLWSVYAGSTTTLWWTSEYVTVY